MEQVILPKKSNWVKVSKGVTVHFVRNEARSIVEKFIKNHPNYSIKEFGNKLLKITHVQ